jgi:DDE superfamily endonuclease
VRRLDLAAARSPAARDLGAEGDPGYGADHGRERQASAVRRDRAAQRTPDRAHPRHAGGADARAFLCELRRRYRIAGTIWLLTDRASAPTDHRTQALAAVLDIRLLWLPAQAPELRPMDPLWRDLKRLIAANRQADTIDALASSAADWVSGLTPGQARRKAGMTSKRFWLKQLVQDFWPPT